MTVAADPPATATEPSERSVQLRAAVQVVLILAGLGAVLGPVWELWSPDGPAGIALAQGVQADETEAFVSGDGKFVVLSLIIGLLAGIAVFLVRPFAAARGPYVAVALGIGGVAGAALTEWVGYLIRGHSATYPCGSSTDPNTCIRHLPLTVHMHGVLLVEALLAVLVYSLFVAFAVDDDLGRPDPSPDATPQGAPYPSLTDEASVGTQHTAHDHR